MAQSHGPTGIPEGGYDGPQAEKMRQERVISNLRERDPVLIERFCHARASAKAAQRAYEAMHTAMVQAVGHGGMHDVLSVIDAEISEFEKRASQQSTSELMKNYRPPMFAYSEEEQRSMALEKKTAGAKK